MKNKFRKIKFGYWTAAFILSLAFLPSVVLAATNIDTDLLTGPIITETSILPGDIFTRVVTVTKLNNGPQSLMLRLERKNPIDVYDLEKKILVKIQRLSDGQFLPLPGGVTEKTLESLYAYTDTANNNAFQFDTISGNANSVFQYKIWFTFDPLADNNYQGKNTEFNVSLGIYSAPPIAVTTADHHRKHHGGGGGGDAAAPTTTALFANLTAAGTAGEAAGEITASGEGAPGEEVEGAVAGEEECVPVAWWIFALILLTYLFVMYFNLFYRIEESKNVRWFWEAVYTVLALVGWYYLDRCRTNVWFVYVMLISGFILYLVYLYLFKKKINRDGNPDQTKLPL